MTQEFQAGEQSFPGYLALPESGSGPGVLVLHAWWGLNATFRDVCDRLAAAGFVALAPDLYHGEIAQTIEEAERLRDAADQNEATSRKEILAAVAVLRHHPAVRGAGLGVIGFSMGGYWALQLAQELPEDIAAVVLFYGSGPPSDERARAAFLGHFAEDDQYEPPEMIDELAPALEAAGHSATIYTYPNTKHWFFEADRPDAYNAAAAALAWDRTLEFLHTHLG